MIRPADGGPAFPLPVVGHAANGEPQFSTFADGMSLRDWFAGQTIVGIQSVDGLKHDHLPALARCAYRIADAMLAESQRRE